jgi:CheY-like chemotaxis protein
MPPPKYFDCSRVAPRQKVIEPEPDKSVSPSGRRAPTRKFAVAGCPGLFTLTATHSVVPAVNWPRLTATFTRSLPKVAVTIVGAVRAHLAGLGAAAAAAGEPGAGVPVSATVEPARKSVAQVGSQSIPAGALVTSTSVGLNRQTPVIMVTASLEPGMRQRAFAAGAVAFLNKPFTAQAFRSVIHSALSPSQWPGVGCGHG